MNRRFPKFAVATPARTVCDDNARVLAAHDALRFHALGTRRGANGVPPELTRLNPAIGLAAYVFAKLTSDYYGEYWRTRLHPWFDRWVKKQLVPGDHLISSYGYTNQSFKWVRQNGGKTFLDGGNSHIDNFWEIISEEHARWGCKLPPIAPHWRRQAREMIAEVDYVLAPSRWVANSFLTRGFHESQIIKNVYPIDLRCFLPAEAPRPTSRPLTVICTGSLSLRKGTPYLLEAFRIIRKSVPTARLLLTRIVANSMTQILERYRDLPIEWAPPLPHPELAKRLREADVFVLPSLEEGLARTSIEALACGLPTVVTAHCGTNDLVEPGVNGEVIPIRDPDAIAQAVLKWWERIDSGNAPKIEFDRTVISFETFAKNFVGQLRALDLLAAAS